MKTRVFMAMVVFFVGLFAAVHVRATVTVDVGGIESYAVANNGTLYRFDAGEAVTHYTNQQDGPPEVSCAGYGCSMISVPPAPDAPMPDTRQSLLQANQDVCTFLDGGMLGSRHYGQTAVVTINVGPVCSKTGPCPRGPNAMVTYTYTYGYNITGRLVAAGTAWQLDGSGAVVSEPVQGGNQYSFTVTGNVVTTSDDVTFNVNRTIHVVIPGCSTN